MALTFEPASAADLADYARDNASQQCMTLCPVGGGTALGPQYVTRNHDVAVHFHRLNRVLDYPARDMTVTVESGLKIRALTDILAAEGQRLPIDIAQSGLATIGGALAANTSGPRRYGHGTFRDYVIGISAVDAQGRLFKAGGRVVKNVAGYDICKLLVGSRGSLAMVTQVTLKLRPLSATSELLWLSVASLADTEVLLQRLLTTQSRPVAIEVLNPAAAARLAAPLVPPLPVDHPVLCLGLEGTEREVQWQRDTLLQELVAPTVRHAVPLAEAAAEPLWRGLTEFPSATQGRLTWVATLRPSHCMEFVEQATRRNFAVQAHAGSGVVIGQIDESACTAAGAREHLAALQGLARSASGYLQVDACPGEWRPGLLTRGLPEPAWALMGELKRAWDPQTLLRPGLFLEESDDSATPGRPT